MKSPNPQIPKSPNPYSRCLWCSGPARLAVNQRVPVRLRPDTPLENDEDQMTNDETC
jgi:hypothetical protein